MLTFLQDIRFAFRQFGNHAGFALTAILSLALGIGATVSVFSIVYAVLMNPWPYAGADRICTLSFLDKAGNEDNWSGLTGPQIRQLRQAHSLEDVMGINEWSLTVTGGDVPEDVHGIYLTPSGLQFLGLPAMLGRNFLPSDAPDGQEPQQVVVLSHKFWQRHFNGDPSVVGKPIQLVHKTYTILGVLPPRFTWEDGDVYLPLNLSASQTITYGVLSQAQAGRNPGSGRSRINSALPAVRQRNPNSLSQTIQTRGAEHQLLLHARTRAPRLPCCSEPWDCCWRSDAAMFPFCCWRAARRGNMSSRSGQRWGQAVFVSSASF